MSISIAYSEFVDLRAKLRQAACDLAGSKNSAASNRLRSVKKHLDEWEATRDKLNCESEGRLNHLQKLHQEVEASK